MRCKVQQLARYYLAELWGDSDFRADWERIKTKLSQDAELTELWQRAENPDLSFGERMRADQAVHCRMLTELREFCTRWKLPRIIARAFEHEAATPPETRAFFARYAHDPAAYELQRLQGRMIGETPTGQVVVIRAAEDGSGLIAKLEPEFPEPPLKCLPEPDPTTETQAEYIRRVCTAIPISRDTFEPETYLQKAIREYRERFPNLYIRESALLEHIEAILKSYYNACAERVKPTRHYNRTLSDTYLQLAARRIYLAVIKKKLWKEVAYETGLASSKKAREDTLKNMAILGIPAECVARRKTRKPRD
jgi:hypothetical protein